MDELNSSCLPALKYARTNKFLGVFNNVILWLILSDSQSEDEFILIIIMEIKL